MYIPPLFKEDRIDVLHAAIRDTGLATLVTLMADGLIASHVPMLLDDGPEPYGTLLGHVARPNPQARGALPAWRRWRSSRVRTPTSPLLVRDQAARRQGGADLELCDGSRLRTIEFFNDADRLLDVVTRLTNREEGRRAEPWAVTDAPTDYIDGMLKGIVGFAIPITRLEGKWKMSQNRPAEDRAGVVAGLTEDGREAAAALITAPRAV